MRAAEQAMARRKPSRWQLPLRIERSHGGTVPREPARRTEAALHSGLTLDELLAACTLFLNELAWRTGVRPVAPYERDLHGKLVELMLGRSQRVFSTLGLYIFSEAVAPHRVLYVGKSTDYAAMVRGRILAHLLPSGGRAGVAARLREAMKQLPQFDSDWQARQQCLRQAVFGANRWSRCPRTKGPGRQPDPRYLAAARLIADGAFDVTVIPLRGDGAEYAPALEWMALEAARVHYGGLPPLNGLHAMLSSNGHRGLKVRWSDPEWREHLRHCANQALSAVRPHGPGPFL
jgi:hypothetical protein